MNIAISSAVQGGEDGAKREIAEDPEGVKEREQLFVQQPVKQVDSGSVRDSG